MSTAEAPPWRSLPNQTFDCDQQCYPYQPTVSFSDGDGIKHAVSTNPEHETQSLLISNNATLCENNTSSFFNPAGTAATNTPVCCYFSVHHPSSSIQYIPVNNFNNDSRVVGNMPAISNQYSGYNTHAILSQPLANLICRNQNLLSHNMYSNPASVNNPFSGQSAVISQPNVPLMSQWTHAAAQCIAGVTSDGNTNPSVGVFSSVTPISQQQFPHVSSGGTVYYGFPNHDASAENTYIYQQQPLAADPSNTLPSLQRAPQPQAVTLNDLFQALSVSKKDPLPEWKLAQYDGNPLQWHEWFGQFCSTVDAASLSDDVKLTYLKTLVTGKAKSAIAEFAYSGRMYKDALKTLERKFGQPQNVITARLDKLSSFPQLRMHNSENIISFSMTISSLVAVFRSLDYEEDLKSVSLLNQALSKIPPNMRKSWSLFVVKRNWSRPNLIDFNNWLKDKAEAHEQMKNMPGKPKVEEPSKTKAVTRVFASTSTVEKNFEYPSCILCKGKHALWKCSVFKEKTPTQRAKFSAENKLCFSCLQGNHSFRQCPRAKKCTKPGCTSTHSVLLHEAERVFPSRNPDKNDSHTRPNAGQPRSNAEPDKASINADRKSFSKNIPNASSNHADINPVPLDVSCAISNDQSSIITSKGLLPIIKLQVSTDFQSADCLTLCDSASSHSWISAKLVKCLNLSGRDLDLTVNGINTTTVVKTKQVQMKVSSNFDGFEYIFDLTAFVKDELKVGTDTVNIPALQSKYPYLAPIKPIVYSYADVDLIIGQDSFHAIRPEEYFKSEADPNTSPVAVRLPIGWVLSGPMPTSTGFLSTCFKCNTDDTELACQIKRWYEIESYGAYKQVDSRSAEDKRAAKILDSSTVHDGSRYAVGMLWAEKSIMLPDNYYSSLVQLKSLEKRLAKDPHLRDQYSKTIEDDLSKGYVIEVPPHKFSNRSIREWYLPHHPVVNPNKPGKVRRVLNGASKFHDTSLNKSLLVRTRPTAKPCVRSPPFSSTSFCRIG